MAKTSFNTIWNRKRLEKSEVGYIGMALYGAGSLTFLPLLNTNRKMFWQINRASAVAAAATMVFQVVVNKQLLEEAKMEYDNQE